MDYKKKKIEISKGTREMREFENKTDNIYKVVVMLSKRSNQILPNLLRRRNTTFMKILNISFLYFLLVSISNHGYSQGTTCATATPFCTAIGTPFTYVNSTTGGLGAVRCLQDARAPNWFYVKTTTPGTYVFDIRQSTTAGGPANIDVDFIAFGPYSSPQCTFGSGGGGLTNDCSSLGSPWGYVEDCSYCWDAVETMTLNPTSNCQVYMILITNYSRIAGYITFTQTSGPATDCTITFAANAAWTTPAPLCVSSSSINLNTLLDIGSTPGGVWSGTGVAGGVFDPAIAGVGTYAITYTLGTGPCAVSVSHNISVANSAIANAGIDQNICGTTATLAGNVPIGTGVWTLISGSGSVTTPSSATSGVTGLGVGPNVFQWTVSNSCGSNSDLVTITGTSTPTANAGTDQTICSGQSATLIATGGGTYAWSNSASTGSSTVSRGSTTTYTVTVTSSGCTASDNILVTVNSVTANAGIDQTICSGKSATLTASGGGTYSWSNSASTASTTVTPGSTSTYTVTVTSGGCTASDNIQVTVNTTPTANAGIDQTICSGQSATLTASGGGTYAWSNSASTASTSVSPGSTSTYTVTITSSGCTASDNIQVTVNTTPTANAGIDQTICTSQSAILTATGGGTYAWSNSATTASTTVTPGSTTTYTVTVTNSGCTASDNIQVTVSSSITANAGIDQTICSGQSATLTATGGGTYVWSNSASTASTSVSPGSTSTYTVTVTSGGCSGTDNVVVNVNTLPIANAGIDQTICSGQSAILTATGGGTYIWSNSASTASTSVSPGSTATYTVTVTSSGCSASDNIQITVNATPTANAGIDQTICSGQSATLTATGGGTYVWSNSASTASTSVSPFSTTTYTVTITNSGCTATDNIQVIVNPLPIANAGIDQTICSGQSATLTATGGGTYSWSNSASTASTSVSPVSSTTYTVTVISSGCTASDNILVTITDLPIANAGFDQTICTSQSAILTATGGGTYAWSNSASTASTTVSPGSNTTYTVTVTNNGCTATDDILVTVASTIIANAGIDQTICSGQSATLIASGGATYSWSNSASTASTLVTPASTATYTVTVSSGGCTGTDDVVINVNTTPIANAGLDQNICIGQSAIITATGGGTYLWDDSSVNDSLFVTPSDTATYSVTVTANGCTSSDDVTINVNTIPVADAGSDQTICAGQTATLIATGGISYSWSNSANTASTNVSPGITTAYTVTVSSNGCSDMDTVQINVTPLPIANAGNNQTICSGQSAQLIATGGGTYLWNNSSVNDSITVSPVSSSTYTVTVTNNGCSASDNVILTVNTTPSANAGADQAICSGTSATLTASGGGTYNWSNTASTANTSVSPVSTTTYSVTVTTNGCTDSDNITITVNPLPTADAGIDQSICSGSIVTLTASGGGTYLWSNSQNTSSISVSPTISASYTVTVTNAQGCSDVDMVMVNVNPLPVVSFSGLANIYCESASSETLTGVPAGGSFSGTGISGNTFDPATAGNGGPYNVTYTYTYSNGCTNKKKKNVSVSAPPVVDLTSNPPDGNAYLGQLITFSADPITYSDYTFYVDSTQAQNGTPYIYLNGTLQDGQVVYVMVNENGCIAIDSIIVDIKPISNAFTPDEDGKNDVFLKGLDLTIINRWDQVLYKGIDGWDGTFNGKKVSPGTYYYIIKLIDANNNPKELHGAVTVVHSM